MGAILAPGQRTVTAILRIVGLSQEVHFQNYHRVLNRAIWSSLELSRVLLLALLAAFVPRGPVVLSLDDAIERRRGTKIRAKGIYWDPASSCHSYFVKACGLRWLSLMLLSEMHWAKAVWANIYFRLNNRFTTELYRRLHPVSSSFCDLLNA